MELDVYSTYRRLDDLGLTTPGFTAKGTTALDYGLDYIQLLVYTIHTRGSPTCPYKKTRANEHKKKN